MLNMYLENVTDNGEVEVVEYSPTKTEAVVCFSEPQISEQ